MPGQTLNDWLYDFATRFDISGDDDVRPPEVIAGSSGAQVSTGENTDQSVMEAIVDKTDVVDEARENAEANDRRYVSSAYEASSNPMQSPNLGQTSDFRVRHGVGFLCWDYEAEGEDLPDIEDLKKPTGAYKLAFRGLDKVRHYENPTSRDIVVGIQKAVLEASKALKGRGQAELVVSFQGHGEGGGIRGVDDVMIKSNRLLALAKKAANVRVSVTYMLDACHSGNAVPRFQDHAANVVEERIRRDVEEADGMCSADNVQRANELRVQMAHARELISASGVVGYLSSVAADCFERLESTPDDDDTRATLREINERIIDKIEQTEKRFWANFDNATPAMRLAEVGAVFPPTLAYLRGLDHGTSYPADEWASVVGNYQDVVSDGANRVIREVEAQL